MSERNLAVFAQRRVMYELFNASGVKCQNAYSNLNCAKLETQNATGRRSDRPQRSHFLDLAFPRVSF